MPLNSSFFPSILYNTEYSPLGSTVSRGNGAERSSPPCRSCASTPDGSSNSCKYKYFVVVNIYMYMYMYMYPYVRLIHLYTKTPLLKCAVMSVVMHHVY